MIKLACQNFSGCTVEDFSIIRRSLLIGVSSASEIVDEFEEEIAKYLNVDKNCVLATNSGTSALHLALIGSGVKRNDYVLLPTLTFNATANVVKYIGAKVILGDVDIDNWCLDVKYIKAYEKSLEKYRPKQKPFIIPVDLYGNTVDYSDEYDCEYFEDCKSFMIIDAAESFGSRKIELFGEDFVCFSFNGNKIITTGSGGLLVGQREEIKRLKHLSTQAKKSDGYYDNIGYNYRMSGISAALGLIQLRRIDEFLEKKKEINRIYWENIEGIGDIIPIHSIDKSSYWLTSILLPEDINVKSFQKYLFERGIETRRIFTPLHFSKPFYSNRKYKNAEYIYKHGLCLPSSTTCTRNDILYVCGMINKGIKGNEFKIKK